MRLLSAPLLLVIALAAGGAAIAQEIHGCIKSNGVLKVAAVPGDCGNNETPISWNVQGPQGPMGDTGDPGMDGVPGMDGQPGPSLRVFDDNGVEVGLYMDGGPPSTKTSSGADTLRIFHEPSGVSFIVDSDGNLDVRHKSLFFEQAGCVEPNLDVQNPFTMGGVLFATGRGFAVLTGEPASLKTFLSSMGGTVSVPGVCNENPSGSEDPRVLAPAREITLEELGLTFPLPAPLHIGLPPEE